MPLNNPRLYSIPSHVYLPQMLFLTISLAYKQYKLGSVFTFRRCVTLVRF